MAVESWVNGQLDAGPLAADMGLMNGWSGFETLRCYGATPFRLEAHLRRLQASLEALYLEGPPLEQVRAEILGACATDHQIRYTVTASGARILTRHPIDKSRIARPVPCAWLRWDGGRVVSGAVKHGCRGFWSVAAKRAGVEEVILCDSEGHILEASRSNLVAVVGGVLLTPPADGRCLEGVTRGALFDAAQEAGLRMEEADLRVGQHFDELYLCSTLKELAPVTGDLGAPRPVGPVGQALHRAFRALVRRECGEAETGPIAGEI